MSRNITLSISLITAAGWVFIAGGVLLAVADVLHPRGWDGVGVLGFVLAIVGQQVLARSVQQHFDEVLADQAELQIQAFELGRRSPVRPVH